VQVDAEGPAVGFQSVSGLWDRRNYNCYARDGSLVLFQSVSGLWDRRNGVHLDARDDEPVSIRLRSVGPEKWA